MTYRQLNALYEQAQLRRIESMRFQAALNGVDLNDDKKKDRDELPREGEGKFEGCVWGKPETYKHLSSEELKEWSDELIHGTQKIMGFFKQ